MTCRSQTLLWWLEGRRGKDDRNQNTLVALMYRLSSRLLLLSMYPFDSTVLVAERSRIKL
jgi:hypothetical protein